MVPQRRAAGDSGTVDSIRAERPHRAPKKRPKVASDMNTPEKKEREEESARRDLLYLYLT